MKFAYTCIECGVEFDYRTADCEDWRAKNRKFGCPHCHTFFREEITTVRSKGGAMTAAAALAMCAGAGLTGLSGFSWHGVALAGGSAYVAYRLVERLRKFAPRLILKRIETLDDSDEIPAR